ncbi:DeoR/GlpR family DNA-binding transcription regulator [Phytoactinopolyspora limicola]|uniref:DeoR/GlpR family DNA-binding transcription regulator n=1 Tax=Phytoactinopolyspora limicola TaxID=2715536 RepID=UPI00140BEAD0|nr:DeoR/GlpR family DNA-binding transcription regulator [Phytoactinopolyspora limicola]
MLAAERHTKILDEVRRNGAARVVDLARSLDVSEMTVRRDLDVLAREGRLEKVHGGATRRVASAEEPGFEVKSLRQPVEKEAIAAAAAEMITPGSAIGLSAGTTTWSLARRLRGVGDLTVVTNSMRVADVLHGAATSSQNVVLTGGVRTPSDALVGPLAVAALERLHLDVVFLGVHGMDDSAGYTTPNLLEADADRALVAAGRRLVVLADHTKWGTVGLSTIAALDQADVVISDEALPDEGRRILEERVAEVRLVPSGASERR